MYILVNMKKVKGIGKEKEKPCTISHNEHLF
jgi:hypothetical protein